MSTHSRIDLLITLPPHLRSLLNTWSQHEPSTAAALNALAHNSDWNKRKDAISNRSTVYFESPKLISHPSLVEVSDATNTYATKRVNNHIHAGRVLVSTSQDGWEISPSLIKKFIKGCSEKGKLQSAAIEARHSTSSRTTSHFNNDRLIQTIVSDQDGLLNENIQNPKPSIQGLSRSITNQARRNTRCGCPKCMGRESSLGKDLKLKKPNKALPYDFGTLTESDTWAPLPSNNAYINGLMTGSKWGEQDPDNASITLNYYFLSNETLPDGEFGYEWTIEEIAAATSAMQSYSEVANITFAQVDSFDEANIKWASLDGRDSFGALGWAYTPESGIYSGITTVNYEYYFDENGIIDGSINPGSYYYLTFTHELGHALGLKHPHDEDLPYEEFPGVSNSGDGGDNGLNAGPWTVMTYNDSTANNGYSPTTDAFSGFLTALGAFDVAAIQYLYGANLGANTGDSIYDLSEQDGYLCIWDNGGRDLITGERLSTSLTIDLRNATLENALGGGGYVSRINNQSKGFTIAYNSTGFCVIEDATGGSGGDVIIGNFAANTLKGGKGNDRIDGKEGTDRAVFTGDLSDYQITQNANNWLTVTDSVSGRDGIDTLSNIEFLVFADQEIQIDTESADLIPPTIREISVQNNMVILDFSEPVTASSAALNAFNVATVSSRNRTKNRRLSTILSDQDDSSRIHLELTGRAPSARDNLMVSYASATNGAVQDQAGNDLSSFANYFADTYISSTNAAIASQYDNLMLTGNSGISAAGNSLDNTIAGNSGNNTLSGLAGADILYGEDGEDILIGGADADMLTGGAGPDIFRFSRTDTLLSSFDHITDLEVGIDWIDGPRRVAAIDVKELGAVSGLTPESIAALLTPSNFKRRAAASFTYGNGEEIRTFLALNNGGAGFSSSKDAIIEITGYTGVLTDLAVV